MDILDHKLDFYKKSLNGLIIIFQELIMVIKIKKYYLFINYIQIVVKQLQLLIKEKENGFI
jgi:hypothetical protein